ncbi:OLC1v1030941C1 [Oldenlandia corymbosa var. corymbosa]|uniref:OLC1v1030941C1 n=1 Tax=Oldenlandia corymbosa var. corymbosa TaxID=529605 RepID=A0AAV1CKJ4_OLDCO|nr:OLC1v1030941C1 [Oldenlandia corymbosa var. corymbosa]
MLTTISYGFIFDEADVATNGGGAVPSKTPSVPKVGYGEWMQVPPKERVPSRGDKGEADKVAKNTGSYQKFRTYFDVLATANNEETLNLDMGAQSGGRKEAVRGPARLDVSTTGRKELRQVSLGGGNSWLVKSGPNSKGRGVSTKAGHGLVDEEWCEVRDARKGKGEENISPNSGAEVVQNSEGMVFDFGQMTPMGRETRSDPLKYQNVILVKTGLDPI